MFIPDLKSPEMAVPFFEDSQNKKIPGYSTTKSIEKLKNEIAALLGTLGAFNVSFNPGTIEGNGNPKRYGMAIYFNFAATKGKVVIAALPIRKETPYRKEHCIKQALYLYRNKVEAMVFANIYEPGSMPLVPYLIGNNGKTVTEELIAQGQLPMLGSGGL